MRSLVGYIVLLGKVWQSNFILMESSYDKMQILTIDDQYRPLEATITVPEFSMACRPGRIFWWKGVFALAALSHALHKPVHQKQGNANEVILDELLVIQTDLCTYYYDRDDVIFVNLRKFIYTCTIMITFLKNTYMY